MPRGTDNRPPNFGSSATFRCRVMGKHGAGTGKMRNTGGKKVAEQRIGLGLESGLGIILHLYSTFYPCMAPNTRQTDDTTL